jgi:hypothetical protein
MIRTIFKSLEITIRNNDFKNGPFSYFSCKKIKYILISLRYLLSLPNYKNYFWRDL